jgi:hypothetical protein
MFSLIHEAGFAGWIVLLLFIAGIAAVTTVGRRWGRPGSTAAAWAVAVLAAGALGYGSGQRKVDEGLRHVMAVPTQESGPPAGAPPSDSEQIQRAQMRVAMLSRGTAEAAANYVLAGAGALILCLLGGVLVFFRRDATASSSPSTAAPPIPAPARG